MPHVADLGVVLLSFRVKHHPSVFSDRTIPLTDPDSDLAFDVWDGAAAAMKLKTLQFGKWHSVFFQTITSLLPRLPFWRNFESRSAF